MKLYNKGKRQIDHAESHVSGSACVPGKVFTVSDELGHKLKKMYRNDLEDLSDATAKFADAPPPAAPSAAPAPPASAPAAPGGASAPAPAPAPATPPPGAGAGDEDEAALAERQEAESLGVSVEDLRKMKAE